MVVVSPYTRHNKNDDDDDDYDDDDDDENITIDWVEFIIIIGHDIEWVL